ncbi:hypothetical protein HAX54_044165 [Datura stramonium]|uniref:Uncharacterized protein n=1 Tax=Datura stramonium TaxID=4076 RepID=A0ABS8RP13_DATST|nr:hypothetical protein [Datura stramonium]
MNDCMLQYWLERNYFIITLSSDHSVICSLSITSPSPAFFIPLRAAAVKYKMDLSVQMAESLKVSTVKSKDKNSFSRDMDFTLVDFGKMSSFNIDMSDLDISSPCKKDRKSKETSKKDSTVAVSKERRWLQVKAWTVSGLGQVRRVMEKRRTTKKRIVSALDQTRRVEKTKERSRRKECSSAKRIGNEGSGSHLNEDIDFVRGRGSSETHCIEWRRNNSSSLQEHVNSVAVDVNFLGVGTDSNEKVLLDSNTNYDKSVFRSSSLEDVATSMKNASERRNFDNDKHVLETNKDRTETHSDSMSNATEDKMQDRKVDAEIRVQLEAFCISLSKIVAENLTAEKRTETGVIRSKFFMPSIKPAAQMQMTTSLTETKVPAFSNKRIGPIPQSRPAVNNGVAPIPAAKRTLSVKQTKHCLLKLSKSLLETSKPENFSTNSDLMTLLPSKRLPQSPNGSRLMTREHSGNGNKTSKYESCQISLCNVPMRMNTKELGSSSAIEDDENIKKAQALSKDLEDALVCSSLNAFKWITESTNIVECKNSESSIAPSSLANNNLFFVESRT